MSFFDDASLVMIPSGYKDQKVYSVKPTDGTGDLTFSRASSATRVQSDGLIEKVRTNLVLQSEAFNTTWAVNGIVVTANSAANPLTGTTTADTITADAANNFHLITQSITYSANENTVSIYVKANGYSWFLIDPSITNAFGYFNVTTGAVGTKGSACTTSISNVGGGWYRCSVTFTPSAGAAICNFSIRDADNGGAFLGDGVSGFFIFGAQAETGVATDYIATTTAAVSVGPVANVPRLDYLNSSCGKLLLEPQRQNLVTFSEQMDNAAWSKDAVSVSANTSTSPDGYSNADSIVENSATAFHFIQQTFTSSAVSTTYSIFAKLGSGTRTLILREGVNTGASAAFNLSTGVVAAQSGGTATITQYANGYYRCTLTFTAVAGTSSMQIALSNANSFASYAGNGTSSIIVYGAQIEAASYATSYIPTLGAAVTRGADGCLKTGISSLIGQTEGTLFLDFNLQTTNQDFVIGQIYNSSTPANSIYFYITSANVIEAFVDNGGNQARIIPPSASAQGNYKLAIGYKANDFVYYINGVQIGTDTSGTVPTCNSVNLIDYVGVPTYMEKAAVNQYLLFKTRLTNAQLAELTA
jgi:hypothetical protein